MYCPLLFCLLHQNNCDADKRWMGNLTTTYAHSNRPQAPGRAATIIYLEDRGAVFKSRCRDYVLMSTVGPPFCCNVADTIGLFLELLERSKRRHGVLSFHGTIEERFGMSLAQRYKSNRRAFTPGLFNEVRRGVDYKRRGHRIWCGEDLMRPCFGCTENFDELVDGTIRRTTRPYRRVAPKTR